MSYDQEVDKLLEMIDDAHRLPYSADDTINAWRNIIEISDELAEKNIDYLEDNLSLRNEFSKRLFDGQRFDEAAECDEKVLAKLNSRSDGEFDSIVEAIREREAMLSDSILGNGASNWPKTKINAYMRQASSTSASHPRQAKRQYRSSLPEPSKPPSPWIKPRRAFTNHQVFQSNSDPAAITSKGIQNIPSTLKSAQEPAQLPRRSYTVAGDELDELKPEDPIEQVDDILRLVTNPPEAKRTYFLEDTTGPDTPQHRADRWFRNLEHLTHNFLFGKNSEFQNSARYVKVKVAILDTGISLSTKEEKMRLQSYRPRIKKIESFLKEESASAGNIDEKGHGTAVTCLLLKTSPNAEAYVARVARWKEDGWDIDKDAVARALIKAVDEWKVDIINMSFGWDRDDHAGVRDAISHAKLNNILLFASTSNGGVGPPNNILYPARSLEVIAIDAADGSGDPASFNPSTEDPIGKSRYTALGVAIKSPTGEKLLSGTSFASPIAAGIAALVLEFARQLPLGYDASINERLKTNRGMLLILGHMGVQKDAARLHFLCPWFFLRGNDSDLYGGDGRLGSRRAFVAYRVIDILQKEFGEEIGKEFHVRSVQEMSRIFEKV